MERVKGIEFVPERVEEYCGAVGYNEVLGTNFGEDPPALPASTGVDTRPKRVSQKLQALFGASTLTKTGSQPRYITPAMTKCWHQLLDLG